MSEVFEPEVIDPTDNLDVITDIVFTGKKDVTIKDIDYMCNYLASNDLCEKCPLNGGDHCGYALLLKKFKTGKNLNNSILQWLLDNPPTSFLMDIKVKMPNVELDDKYNIPNFCVQNIYGKDCCNCNINNTKDFSKDNPICRHCWKTPMDNNIREEYEKNDIIDIN